MLVTLKLEEEKNEKYNITQIITQYTVHKQKHVHPATQNWVALAAGYLDSLLAWRNESRWGLADLRGGMKETLLI